MTQLVCIVKEGQFLTFYHFVGKKQSDKKFGKKTLREAIILRAAVHKKREKNKISFPVSDKGWVEVDQSK